MWQRSKRPREDIDYRESLHPRARHAPECRNADRRCSSGFIDPILQDCNPAYNIQRGHANVQGTCYEKATLLQHVRTQLKRAKLMQEPQPLVDPYRNPISVPTIGSLYPTCHAFYNKPEDGLSGYHINNDIKKWAARGRQAYPLADYTTLLRGRREDGKYTTMAFPRTVKWRNIKFRDGDELAVIELAPHTFNLVDGGLKKSELVERMPYTPWDSHKYADAQEVEEQQRVQSVRRRSPKRK